MRVLLPAVLAALLMGGCVSSPALTVAQETAEAPAGFEPALFQRACEALMAGCPLNSAVRVQVGALEGYYGRTHWAGQYEIEIEGRQPMQGILDTLIHEWAHAMVWDATEDPVYEGHGPLWGVAFARAYRVVMAELSPPADD
jgi:hypothetical protein